MKLKKYTLYNVKMTGMTLLAGEIQARVGIEAEEVSDGYYTMSELYDHRRALTAALCNSITAIIEAIPRMVNKIQTFKCKYHYDKTMFDGYFMIMIIFRGKQISYHYDLKYWDDFTIPEYEYCPFPHDGHTGKDVIERLLEI